ncbi:MAG: hypothetical protein ACK5PP_12575 [Acidimicrobiales bacterium]
MARIPTTPPGDTPTTPAGDAGPDDHDDFGGLQRDTAALLTRRRALRWVAGIGLAGVAVACGADVSTDSGAESSTSGGSGSSSTGSTSTSTGSTTAGAGEEIPEETAGPYPADGTNGPNVLGTEGLERSDMTTSFGDYSGTADGVRTTMQYTVVDASTGDPIAGAAFYLWHCTAGGQYSLYEVEDQNYLRALQITDDAGKVSFSSVFPGCYSGRWPHTHFEIYSSVDEATTGRAALRTSQLALPQADCEVVYEDDRYGNSLSNLGRLSLATDNIFRDGWESQLGTVSGSNDEGYTVSLLVRV